MSPDVTAIILDTETTDVEKPEVMELAHCDWPLTPSFPQMNSYRFKPLLPPKFGAVAVHHIFTEDVNECEPAANAPSRVPPTDYWIGHNIDFDWKALGSPPCRRICTLALARTLLPELDSHTLSAVYYYLFGTTEQSRAKVKGAHGAAADVVLCAEVFEVFVERLGTRDLHQLWIASEDARIPRIMTFGKFKGQPISAVDRGYANWYRKQEDTDPYVMQAFRRAGLCS